MTFTDELNIEQKEAIEKLRLRMKNVLPPEMHDDTITFYRFLKARDFDIDKAEIMLGKFISWRKAFQLEDKFHSFEYSEVFRKYLKPSFIGYAKLGSAVAYVPAGKMEMGNFLKAIKMNDFLTHLTVFGERTLITMEKENEKVGKYPYQAILILDLDKLTLANTANRSSTELFLRISQILQDNYPERLKTAYVINAPAYYVLVYSIVKRFMSKLMAQKIRVFGQNGWKEELLKVIDDDVLPAFLGGNRTDSDGNPQCLNSVIHGSKVTSKYFLTNEQRWFKDPSIVKKLVISPMEKSKVPINVPESGLLIEWEFESKNKDIAFGLFFQDLENEIEVLPIQRLSTLDGTAKDCYKTQWAGTYVIVFDNSYSWMSSKEVRYCITVTKPK